MDAPLKLPDFFDEIISRFRARGDLKLKFLVPAITKLYEMFTGQVPMRPDYMAQDNLRLGYAYYYTPTNSLKLQWVLSELTRYDPEFFNKRVRMLDYGCGTGSASLGALHTGHPFDVTAYDQISACYDDARFLFETYQELSKGSSRIDFARVVPPEASFDLIVAMNVLNEMSSERSLFPLLRSNLAPGGYFVVIEPANRENTLALQRFRDKIADKGFHISAPCLTDQPCPMLATLPSMWCCMDVNWERPRFIAEIDERLGLNKTSLKFSYVVATRDGKTLGARGNETAGRLVGDIHKEKGKHWGMFCFKAAALRRCELLSRNNADENLAFRHARRGEIFEIPCEPHGEVDRIPPEPPIRKIS